MQPAIVIDDRDPSGMGRLKVVVASPEEEAEVWAEACLPPIPPALIQLPKIGDTIWIHSHGAHTVWMGVMVKDDDALVADTISLRASDASLDIGPSVAISNGKGASITMTGSMVTINGGALEVV